MTWRRLTFWVDGPAVSFRDAYGQSRRPSAEAIAWRHTIAWECRIAANRKGFPLNGDFRGPALLLVEAYGSAADWDNIGKEVSDALEHVAYRNDRQVVNARVKFPQRQLTKEGGIARSGAGEASGVLITLGLPLPC